MIVNNGEYAVWVSKESRRTRIEYNNMFNNRRERNQYAMISASNSRLDPDYPPIRADVYDYRKPSARSFEGAGKDGATIGLISEADLAAEAIDKDRDGVADEVDQCKGVAEDQDGFEDDDGCPDPDNDGDGILDVDDACPNDAGPPENNGCPDPDRDGDGVPDRIDNCPDEPGTVENQGCQAKQLVVISEDKIEILERVYFRKGSAKLQKRSWALLDQVAAVLIAHPELKKVRVEGHTDKSGSLKYNMILSKKRANTVVRYLVGRGQVSRSRLVARGFGPKRPLVKNPKTKEEEALNRRVEFHIVAKDEAKK
jgi:outer membrane protein OmpA-like peptidoglycan-associated protein